MRLTVPHESRLRELMKKSQEGDSEAYIELLNDLSGIIRNYVARRTREVQAREEILQEILIAVHSARHTYLPEKPFYPWFFAIVRHRYVDYVRRWGRISRNEVLDSDFIEQTFAEEEKESSHQPELSAMLSSLPTKQRRAVEMLKLEGRSIREVAGELKMSEGALKVMAHRTYQRLKKLYRREYT